MTGTMTEDPNVYTSAIHLLMLLSVSVRCYSVRGEVEMSRIEKED